MAPIDTPIRLSGLIRRSAEDGATRVVQLQRESASLASMKFMAAPREMPHILQGLGGSKILQSFQNPFGSGLAVAFLQKEDVVAFLLKPIVLK